MYIKVQRTFRIERFCSFLFAFSYNNTEIVQRDTSFMYGPNLISVSDPPAMTAFEGSLPSHASSPVPLASTAVFIVTSHLCMNPLAILLSRTHDELRWAEGNASCFLSGSQRWREWEVGLLGQSGNR